MPTSLRRHSQAIDPMATHYAAVPARLPTHPHRVKLAQARLRTVREMGSHGAHLAVGSANLRAIRSYRACGFEELEPSVSDPLWFGISWEARV